MMEFRTCYPKIWQLDLLNILSWRNLRKGRYRSWPSPKQVIRHLSVWGALPVHWGKEHPYLLRQECQRNLNEQSVLSFPHFTTLSSYTFLSYHIFPWLYSSSNLVWKDSGLTISLVFISLWRLLCHIKLLLNQFVCFSLVNLSFVTETQLRS